MGFEVDTYELSKALESLYASHDWLSQLVNHRLQQTKDDLKCVMDSGEGEESTLASVLQSLEDVLSKGFQRLEWLNLYTDVLGSVVAIYRDADDRTVEEARVFTGDLVAESDRSLSNHVIESTVISSAFVHPGVCWVSGVERIKPTIRALYKQIVRPLDANNNRG